MVQLNTIHEAITLSVFVAFALIFFREGKTGLESFGGFYVAGEGCFLRSEKW